MSNKDKLVLEASLDINGFLCTPVCIFTLNQRQGVRKHTDGTYKTLMMLLQLIGCGLPNSMLFGRRSR